jgi:hypothetical protein
VRAFIIGVSKIFILIDIIFPIGCLAFLYSLNNVLKCFENCWSQVSNITQAVMLPQVRLFI